MPHIRHTLPLALSPHRQPGRQDRPVLIVGAGYGKEEAPLDDKSWQVWGLNALPCVDSQGRFRANLWFDIHQRHAQSDDDMAWLTSVPCPVYTTDDMMPHGRNFIRYPIEAVEESYGSYFACTFAYQIALAMWKGVRDIGLYGVDLAFGTTREQTVEWACVSWWVGFAEAKGVTIHLPTNCRLGRHPHRYGLEYDAEKTEVESFVRDRLAMRWSSDPNERAKLMARDIASLTEGGMGG